MHNKERVDLDIEPEGWLKENAALKKKLYALEESTLTLEASNKLLRMVVDGTQAGYWDWNIKTGELSINTYWASIVGYSLDELKPITFDTWTALCHPDDIPLINQHLEKHFAGNTTYYDLELRMRHKLGHWIRVHAKGKIFEHDTDGKPLRMVGSHQDITARYNSEQALARSREFEHLVTALSNKFINLPFEQIDAVISDTLQRIAEYVEADRSYVFQFRDDLRFMNNTHEWCAEGVNPEIDSLQGLETSGFPWWMGQIRNNMVIHLPRIADMGMEVAAEKEILESQNIKSLIVIPLVSGSNAFGYIGFDAVKQEKEWPPETISILKLAGVIIANALQRNQAEHFIQAELDLAIQLNRSSSVLETLQICLHVAILVSGLDCGGIYLVNQLEKTITLAIHEGLPQHFINHSALYHFDSENARLILKGKPVYAQFNELDLKIRLPIQTEQLKAIALLPITYRGEVIACLNVASHTMAKVPTFTRKRLETITSHIGSAIMQARHEESISEEKRNLESLFDTIDDFLFIVNMDGNIIHTNATVRKKLGYSAEEIVNKPVLYFHPEKQWNTANENIAGMLSGTKSACQVPLITSSGNLIPVETKVTKGLWNNKPALFGISRDFSERILSEKKLIESEKRFRELTELLPLTLFETDIRGVVTYANAKSVEVFDYNAPGITKKRAFDCTTPEIKKKSFFAINFWIPQDAKKALLHLEAIKKGHHISAEYTARRKNGSTFPVQVYSLPIIHDDLVKGIRSIVVDLSEMKKAESARRNNEIQKRIAKEFEALIHNIPGTVYQTNHEGNTTIFSMFNDILNDYTKEEFAHGLFETGMIIHQDDRDEVVAANLKLKSTKASQALLYRIIMPNGSIKWLEDRKTPIFSVAGRFTGVDGILFDVTGRVLAQEEKLQLESNIRRKLRLESIGTLAGGIAHDFNNILTPILGYAEMGIFSITKDTLLYGYFSEIIQAAERAKNLVAQILTFSMAQDSTPDIVSVQEIIDEALQLLRPSIPSTITIKKHLDKSCRSILADPSQIHQVIINLCINAFQAMEKSGGLLTITLKEIIVDKVMQKMLPKLDEECYVKLSISDTGSGISENNIDRIFEPFFTTKSVNEGTGLGLSVVHGIIASFKGDISVNSISGKGTTFNIYLPVVNKACEKKALIESIAKGYGNILFVDDESTILKMMTIMITNLGFKIKAMSSPLKALSLFQKKLDNFNLVITDMTMPEMTGLELASEIHKISPKMPIILLTGYEKDIEQTKTLADYGICKLLIKPVRLADMAATINDVIFSTTA